MSTLPYPALRQLPALAVAWVNLDRRVRIEETVYEMLSAQYETARIEEAIGKSSAGVNALARKMLDGSPGPALPSVKRVGLDDGVSL